MSPISPTQPNWLRAFREPASLQSLRLACGECVPSLRTFANIRPRICPGWEDECRGTGCRAALSDRRTKKAASVCEVARHFVLEPQLLFLEAVEKVFVG